MIINVYSKQTIIGLMIFLTFCFSLNLTKAWIPTPKPVDQTPVYSVAWSPDDKRIAIGKGGMGCSSADNTIDIIDPTTGAVTLQIAGHTCEVNSVAWNADGTKLASASSDGTIRIWEPTTGKMLSETESFSSGRIRAVWDPKGDQVADVIAGDAGVEILDPATGSSVSYLCCVAGAVRDVAWSPDGSKLAIAGDVVEVWNMKKQQSLIRSGTNSSPASAVVWNTDGSEIAIGHKDGNITLWDAATAKSLTILEGHTDAITELSWEASGNRLASSSLDGTVRVWNTVTKQQLEIFSSPMGEVIFSVDWDHDGNKLVYGGDFSDDQLDIVIVSTTPS